MLYNKESPPEKNKNIILCPIIVVWVTFILKLFLDIILFFVSESYFKKNDSYIQCLMIASIDGIASLFAAIFVTISCKKRKYGFYETGLIIIMILAIQMNTILLIDFEKVVLYFIEINILLLIVELIVLFLYIDKIKLYFNDSDSNNNNNSNNDLSLEINLLV